ncbi:IS3 family transposase [Streptomyces sp. NPDC056975]|uniref:IS3 family transposase n=1 Tax=Streptomyces sp. NPDC056975 TaxID=3345985 RepID=UPI003632940E
MNDTYAFIEAEKTTHGVAFLCRLLKVARSSFYAWLAAARTRSVRKAADEALVHEITVIHVGSRQTYGVPRVHAVLRRLGRRVNRKRVARTYQDILDAIRWAVAQPPVNGKPNMITVDNVTTLWDMLSDEQALYARRRAERKAQENRRRGPNPDLPVVIDPDLWNRAKDRWGEVLWLLRRHSGPVLLLARQETVTAFENDKPTRDTVRKIKAEKNLPAAVDAIVELHALGEAHLTWVRTLHWDVKPGESTRFPDFSIDTLLRRLGFEDAAAARQVTESRPEAYLQEQDQQRAQEQDQQRQQQEQNQQRQQQPNRQKAQAQQQNGRPSELTGEQARALIHKALTDENNPLECLRAIREEWGFRLLQRIPTKTKMWGDLNADDLISKCLTHIEEQKKKREEEHTEEATTGDQTPQANPSAAGLEEGAREHREEQPSTAPAPPQPESTPPAAEDAVPPPPDPQAEEPPPAERPEETSAAEEPQDLPALPAAKVPAKKKNATEIARQGLLDEAEVQARVKWVTVGEHLGPVSETGEPGLGQLRDFVQGHRAEVIARLEEGGETALADVYRRAPMPDLGIKRKFAAYLDRAPSEQ